MNDLISLMKAEGLTFFEIKYDFKKGSYKMYGAREWEDDQDFSGYNREFIASDLLTEQYWHVSERILYDLCEKHGLSQYLQEVKELMKEGKSRRIIIFCCAKGGIKFYHFEHNIVRGLHNRRVAMTCGGIRRHPADKPEKEVMIDGLNLGRAMTFKNVAAQIPFGGCKIVIQMEKPELEDMHTLGFLAYAADRCRAVTAPDLGLPVNLPDMIQERNLSDQYVCGPASKTGECGESAAYGVYLSMKEAVRFKEGNDSLDGKSILVIGLGAVGWSLAEHLLKEKVKLHVCDVREDVIDRFREKHKDADIQTEDVETALFSDVDIIAPCAVGGVIGAEEIEKMQCRYVWGLANSQLRATSAEEEYALAEKLQDAGILYESEWWHNCGGVICMAEEYLNDASNEQLMRRIEDSIPGSVYNNLKEAAELGITPTKNCYRKCENAVYGEK